MTLDATTQALMGVMAQVFPPNMEELPAAEVRRRVRDASLAARAMVEPEPVAHVADRTIPGEGTDLRVRIYWPSPGRELLPVLVYFHGGGWVIGDLDTHDATCRTLCNGADCIVVSVDYRLAPEFPFPAAAEDCYAATRWAGEEAAILDADGGRLAIGGDSAGGNLAAVVALMARERGGLPAIALQLMIYPVTDVSPDRQRHESRATNREGFLLTTSHMEWYREQYLPSASSGDDPLISPLCAVDLSGLPPALIITAEHDPLRDEGELYGRRLAQAGVPAAVTRYDGVFHGFFGLGRVLAQAKAANENACAALRACFATTTKAGG